MLQQKLEVTRGHDVAVIIFVLGKQLKGDNFCIMEASES
jgi:hypothetical protein